MVALREKRLPGVFGKNAVVPLSRMDANRAIELFTDVVIIAVQLEMGKTTFGAGEYRLRRLSPPTAMTNAAFLVFLSRPQAYSSLPARNAFNTWNHQR